MTANEAKTRLIPVPDTRDAHVSGMAAYDQLVAEAEADYSGYWTRPSFSEKLLRWLA